MDGSQVSVHPVERAQEARYQELMAREHYLGALPKIGETLWYVASFQGEWVALCGFSAAAWKCTVRDRWIGWDFRLQFDRLKLIANNSRFLILPQWHRPNLGSRVLGLVARRIGQDWQRRFGHPLWLLETFVDPQRFAGTVYRAANWTEVGFTKGYRRTRQGYSAQAHGAKRVFTYPLVGDARSRLCGALPDSFPRSGAPKMMMSAEHMRALPEFFCLIADPRRAQGRRHRLPTVLAIAAGAMLCGMRGYKAIADWAHSLGPKALARFGCRRDDNGHYLVPSESIIRDVLIRVDPQALDQALQRWNARFGQSDESLAIDGKTMCNAIDAQGQQTHVMSVVGHASTLCYTQKKSEAYP
jgi:Domain of unknown function (DUF4338)/DDE_Tnp_1-associated